jgi:cold shock CspA family protein
VLFFTRASTTPTVRGVVTYYDYNKGYVFLRPLDADATGAGERFFHVTQLGVSRLWGLGVGCVVEYEPAGEELVERVRLTQ